MKRRTKLISLLAVFAASTVVASVPAYGDTPSNFVTISNRDGDAHKVSISEYRKDGTLVHQGDFTIGSRNAHYWVIEWGDAVKVTGPDNFSQSLPATSLPHCYRIDEGANMHSVADNCTAGGTRVW